MGSKWIWIIASVAFGLVSGGVYAWLRRKDGKSLRRWALWSVIYTGIGLAICRVLLVIFAG